MPQEIERKFLVDGEFRNYVTSSEKIAQGYLSSVPERIVRVRIRGEKAFLTIKGITNISGMSRFEWEKEIQLAEAEELLNLCEKGVVIKIRHIVPFEGMRFEIDEFLGANKGLIIAEVELRTESDSISTPEWLGREVTGDRRYYNSNLSKIPFSEWDKAGESNK